MNDISMLMSHLESSGISVCSLLTVFKLNVHTWYLGSKT